MKCCAKHVEVDVHVCLLSTEVETMSARTDGTKKPWFVVEAQNTWAEVGGRATFEAQASGAPVPSFKWSVHAYCYALIHILFFSSLFLLF
jgi:hypothetical protein